MADHLSCQEIVELVTDYLEQALPADEASLVEQHTFRRVIEQEADSQIRACDDQPIADHVRRNRGAASTSGIVGVSRHGCHEDLPAAG